MTRRQVRKAFGRPTDRVTMGQLLGQYETSRFLGRSARGSEAWVYVGRPQPGLSTYVNFESGRVTVVQVRSEP